MPQGGRGGLVPCGQGFVRVLPAQSALVLEFLQSPFLGGGRRGCVRGAHLGHGPVRSEIGLVVDHGQVMPYEHVGNDVAFVPKLCGLGREALALIQCGLDLAANRHQCR